MRDGSRIGLFHFEETICPVVAHSGHQHAYGVGSCRLRDGAEQHIHAGAMPRDQRPFSNFNEVTSAKAVNECVPISRRNVGSAGEDLIPVSRLAHFDGTDSIDTLRVRRSESLGHVLHGDDSRTIAGQSFKNV